MTPVFDPFHPLYFDEADLRDELARVHSVCSNCRACVSKCEAFPRLFELLDRPGMGDPASLTDREQDSVIGGCFDCGLCVLGCPDAPGRSDASIDVPRLMARARQTRRRATPTPIGSRVAAGVRRAVVGLGHPRRRMRFSTWMDQRAVDETTDLSAAAVTGSESPTASAPSTPVVIFPTCHVEHHEPEIGRATVGLLEQVGVACSLPEGLVCCGAPHLAQGDLDAFVELGRRNVRVLADRVRAGCEVVVPLPTCAAVVRGDYVAYIGGSDAELVAEHTHDASAYLLARAIEDGTAPATVPAAPGPAGDPGRSVTMHLSCRSRLGSEDNPAVELLRRSGFEVTVVAGCASPDPRAPEALRRATTASIGEVAIDGFLSECPSAMGAVAADATLTGHHPLVLLARAHRLPGI